MITCSRTHEIHCGHRVVNHEGKCKHLHGHSYIFEFTCSGKLDSVGRVIDFSEIKNKLCMWLEDNWDHKTLLWSMDPLLPGLMEVTSESLVIVPFNPTAENIADHILRIIGPKQLKGTGIFLDSVKVNETSKCSATADWKHSGILK